MAFTISDMFGVFIGAVIYFKAIAPELKSILAGYLASGGVDPLEAFFINLIPVLIPLAFVWYIIEKSKTPQYHVQY